MLFQAFSHFSSWYLFAMDIGPMGSSNILIVWCNLSRGVNYANTDNNSFRQFRVVLQIFSIHLWGAHHSRRRKVWGRSRSDCTEAHDRPKAVVGVIFKDWSIGKFKKTGVSVWGQDYGFSNDPSTLIETNIDTSNKRIYLKECFYLPSLTTSEKTRLNQQHTKGGLIIADSAEPRLISEIRSNGSNIKPSVKGQGSITYGISLLQDYDLIIST